MFCILSDRYCASQQMQHHMSGCLILQEDLPQDMPFQTWLTTFKIVLLKRQNTRNKSDPHLDEVELLNANRHYARIGMTWPPSQAYVAGYAEGYITSERIEQTWSNILRGFLRLDSFLVTLGLYFPEMISTYLQHDW
ncbi:uncharacterized protein LOC144411880 [Styela clava]